VNPELLRQIATNLETTLSQPPAIDYQTAWLCLIGGTVGAAVAGWSLWGLYHQDRAINHFIENTSEKNQ